MKHGNNSFQFWSPEEFISFAFGKGHFLERYNTATTMCKNFP